jgi:hypothetical protein
MLNDDTAAYIKAAMDHITAGWVVGKVAMTNEILIIWLVDTIGRLRFSIEELVLFGVPRGIPKHQKCELHATADKLGHPALVGGANARIGGEIFFDPTADPPNWFINNKSGRYGLHPSRTSVHLDNVAHQFAKYGITLQKKFIKGL